MSSYPFAMFVKCGVQFPLCFSDSFCVTGLLHWRWSFDLTDGSVWLRQADFTSVKVLKKNHSRRTGQLRGRGHFLSYSDNSEGILRLQKKKTLVGTNWLLRGGQWIRNSVTKRNSGRSAKETRVNRSYIIQGSTQFSLFWLRLMLKDGWNSELYSLF